MPSAGIVAVNRPVTEAMAEALAPVFTEVVVAPGFEGVVARHPAQPQDAAHPGSRAARARSGPTCGRSTAATWSRPPIWCAWTRQEWRGRDQGPPTDEQWADLELAWRVVARVTSNAIVLVKDGQAVGIGCGQQNRRDAGTLAGQKAAGRAVGGAYASDAFFPFPDGLDGAIEAGATAIIQPGGRSVTPR